MGDQYSHTMYPVLPLVRTLRTAAVFLTVLLATCTTLSAQAAPARPAVASTATITGVVVDSAGRPVSGASVRHASGEPNASTAADGSFRLAGLTAGTVAVEVAHPGYRLLSFEFAIAAGVTASLRLTLTGGPDAATAPAAPSAQAAPTTPTVDSVVAPTGPPLPPRRGGLAGVIVDSAGVRVFGAVVNAVSTPLVAGSDSTGRFRLAPLEPGLQFIRIRKVGYLAEYFPVTIVEGRIASVTVKMRAAGQTLARVNVRADARAAAIAGFEERARLANGLFVRRSELLARGASKVTDVLRGQNGITLVRNGDGNQVAYGRGLMTSIQGCPMGIVVDGTPMVAGRSGLSFSIDQFVNVQDIRAMEVYRSGQAVPAEFKRPETDCGAIIVWTR